MDEYVVVTPCRNEEKYISTCLESALKQTVPPSAIIVVDDGSTDSTPRILREFSSMNPTVTPVFTHYKRYKTRGINTSLATRRAHNELFKRGVNFDYVLNLDADSELPCEYVETLIKEMKGNPSLAICAGIPKGKRGPRLLRYHATNGARLYRTSFLKEALPYPITYAHDSYMLYLAYYLGWKVSTVSTQYVDSRPYRRNLKRWFLTGRFRYRHGFNFFHSSLVTFRYFRQPPLIIGPITGFLTHLIYSIGTSRLKNREYIKFIQGFLNKYTIDSLKEVFKGKFLEHVY